MQGWLCVGHTTKRSRAGYLKVRLTENHGWLIRGRVERGEEDRGDGLR